MRLIRFDPTQDIPIIDARIKGPRRTRRTRLVFDTGSALTQINTSLIENIGYGAHDGEHVIRIQGATGEPQEGYSLRIDSVSFFGLRFENVLVGALDFNELSRDDIDGLLGFDLIKNLHVELDGPQGIIKVFS